MDRETMVWRKGHGVIPKSKALELDREKSTPAKADFLPQEVQRGSWVYRDGKLVPKREAWTVDYMAKIAKRSHLSAPQVMSDIEPYQNMINGGEISSRSHHREFLRRHGVTEVGNEKMANAPKGPKPGEIRQEIKESIDQLEQGWEGLKELEAADAPLDDSDGVTFESMTVDTSNPNKTPYIRANSK